MEAEGARAALAHGAAAALVGIARESTETMSSGLSRISIPEAPRRTVAAGGGGGGGGMNGALTMPGAAGAMGMAAAAEAVPSSSLPPVPPPPPPPTGIAEAGAVAAVHGGGFKAGPASDGA